LRQLGNLRPTSAARGPANLRTARAWGYVLALPRGALGTAARQGLRARAGPLGPRELVAPMILLGPGRLWVQAGPWAHQPRRPSV